MGNNHGAEKEATTCSPEFNAGRRAVPAWYTAHHFHPNQKGCDGKQQQVPERVSIPVYWFIAGDDWKTTDVQPRLDEAKAWFEKYCIKIPFYEVALTTQDSAEVKKLSTVLNDRDAFRNKAVALFESAWKNRMQSPKKSLTLMFVDQFKEIVYDLKHRTGVNSVSGNFWEVPLILLRSNDKGALNIVTHELIHGLGKVIHDDHSEGYEDSADEDNTWGHGKCQNDMGNAKRAGGAGGAFSNPDTDLMDWASYWQMEYEKNIS